MDESRAALARARRIVIKVGSRLLATRSDLIADLARQVSDPSNAHRQFIVVSSGAISLGCQALGYSERPRQMGKLQAAAAVGQGELMRRYADAFGVYGRRVAQVLLTHSDLASRRRLTNAQQAFAALLDAGAVPIVNENDTVSTDEIAFGDNDQLASMVVPLVQAELILLLTDVPGVLDPSGARISTMHDDASVGQAPSKNRHGTGGIRSKLSAARKAAHSGAHVVIGPADADDSVLRIVNGEDVGTLFAPHRNSLRARQHWIAYTLKPRGVVLINEGAAAALRDGGHSLLPVGVVGVRGQFSRGDAVCLLDPNGIEVARGLTRLGVMEVARMAGRSSAEITTQLGTMDPVVVHRDDLVLST